jgi:hypothetical protein
MRRVLSGTCLFCVVVLVLSVITGNGQQTATRYDYLELNEAVINAGMQALFICNGCSFPIERWTSSTLRN